MRFNLTQITDGTCCIKYGQKCLKEKLIELFDKKFIIWVTEIKVYLNTEKITYYEVIIKNLKNEKYKEKYFKDNERYKALKYASNQMIKLINETKAQN